MSTLTPLSDMTSTLHQTTANTAPLSTPDLVNALQTFEQWRAAKAHPGEQIPDSLWEQIFALADTIAPAKLRMLFNVNNAQYQKKWQELHPTDAATIAPSASLPPPTISIPPAFCEARTLPPAYQPAAIPKPVPPLVIEFRRADGCLMKVYTSADRFTDLLTQFFAGECHAAHPSQP